MANYISDFFGEPVHIATPETLHSMEPTGFCGSSCKKHGACVYYQPFTVEGGQVSNPNMCQTCVTLHMLWNLV